LPTGAASSSFPFPNRESCSLAKPLVSIGIPTRNRAASLREGLKSICAQDYAPLEIVISDNASEDNTGDVVRELMRADDRIRYVKHDRNIGLHANHNFCMDAARGEFVCVWHDHDVRDASIISQYITFFDAHPRVGVVCSDWDLIDDDGNRIGVRDHAVDAVTPGFEYIDQTIRSGRTSIGIPGAMVRVDALGDARFTPDAPIGFGDFPLWFRVAESWDVGHLSKRLWSWRQNSVSHSARTIESIALDFQKNISSYCDEHLERWPNHGALVARWQANMRHYLFWALAYEVALHFRKAGAGGQGERSLFEIMDYSLTPEQFRHALEQLKFYRTRAMEYAAYAGIMTMIRLRFTWPVAWVSRHQAALRTVLGLE
jgi:glycosyltransferase involved in cell wall biosynthesis